MLADNARPVNRFYKEFLKDDIYKRNRENGQHGADIDIVGYFNRFAGTLSKALTFFDRMLTSSRNSGEKTVSVHCQARARRKTVVITAVAAGSMIFVNVRSVPQPSR